MIRSRRPAFVLLVASVLLAACSATAAAPSPSPSTVPSPSASASPSAACYYRPPRPLRRLRRGRQPSRRPPPPRSNRVPPQTLRSSTYARVVANDLRVHEEPDNQSSATPAEPPTRVARRRGRWPRSRHRATTGSRSSHRSWRRRPSSIHSAGLPAPARAGEPVFEPATVECPSLPSTLHEVASLNYEDEMIYELTCFGDEEVTFRARLATSSVTCGLELPYGIEPCVDDRCVLD